MTHQCVTSIRLFYLHSITYLMIVQIVILFFVKKKKNKHKAAFFIYTTFHFRVYVIV